MTAAKSTTPALVALTSLFFMWGFLTCLNDILSPHLKAVFELGYTEMGLVQTAFFAAYLVMSLPSSVIVKRLGYKSGVVIGLGAAAAGCLLFLPAAEVRSFPLYLLALFVLASGITLLQVAANPLVAMLVDPASASSRLTLTQAFNSLGTTLAPLFGSAVILVSGVKGAYLGLALALAALAGVVALFELPPIAEEASLRVASASAWRDRRLLLGAIAIFVYVGAEVAIGNYLVSYFKQPLIAGLPEAEGAKRVSFYWGGAMVGRFIGVITTRRYNPGSLLSLHALAAASLVLLSMATSGAWATWSILAVGLCNSIMFPTIFTLAIDRLGSLRSQGAGILCMAIVGGAVVPPLVGALADAVGLHYGFALAALCYGYIAWYGRRGLTA